MRIRLKHPGHRPHHRPAERLISCLLLALLLPFPALAEDASKAFSNPLTPPPFIEEHAPADDDYFSDAVIIGDSLSDDMELYGLFPTAEYVCRIGMGIHAIRFPEFRIPGSDQTENAYARAARFRPRKLYIFLGTNTLDHVSAAQALEDYELVADTLVEKFPDVLIYVISPPSMARWKMKSGQGLSPVRYESFDAGLRDLAERKGFYYLDLFHLLTDEEGYLKDAYAVGDGYHLKRDCYEQVVDPYIRSHTVDDPGTEEETHED